MFDGHGHVLVVDDHRTTRLKLALGLKQQGHTTAEAENGRQAVERLLAESFDLVSLDILMPEMDGYQLLEQMKINNTLRDIPVIVISAQELNWRVLFMGLSWARRIISQKPLIRYCSRLASAPAWRRRTCGINKKNYCIR